MKYRRLKINILLLLVLFFWVESAFARHKQDTPNTEAASAKKSKVTLDVGLGTSSRIDRLDWNIAGFVNVMSELTWDDLEIAQVKGTGRLIIDQLGPPFSFYMRGYLSYGKILKGKNQDSDYKGNNRTNEWSRSNNNADNGNVFDTSIGAGFHYKKKMGASGFTFGIAPLIGLSYHEQNLIMTDGFQTVTGTLTIGGTTYVTPPFGPFNEDLNSSYDAQWTGPWVGFDLFLENGRKTTFFGLFEYHWVDYHAEANWNLKSNFAHPVSFVHDAVGSGIVASLGWEYRFLPLLAVNVSVEYLDWSTDAGIDTTFFSDGTAGVTPLNEVNWESRAFTLGLQYRFQ